MAISHTKDNQEANARFKAALILMFNDIDLFGDITRNIEVSIFNDEGEG